MLRFQGDRLRGINQHYDNNAAYVEKCLVEYENEIQGNDGKKCKSRQHVQNARVQSLEVKHSHGIDEVEHSDGMDEDGFLYSTTVFIRRTEMEPLAIDISQKIGGFDPIIMIYMTDIAEIDISGCTEINALLFVDCIAACTNLQRLSMRSCTQFTEMHVLQMLPKLEKLNYVNLENCQEISYPVAFWVVSCLRKLSMIDFEPKNRVIEIVDWRRLYNFFFLVHFGNSFKRILPNYGSYIRTPEWCCED